MPIFSPSDDFWCRSLAGFPGPLSRLEYVSSLRLDGGGYSHWGLMRVHGEAAANQAVADAHTKIFSEILRTPLKRLQVEVCELASQQGIRASDCLAALIARGDHLVPPKLNGGSKRHFSSIFEALSALERALGLGIDQAA
jgi:hypothetical protein